MIEATTLEDAIRAQPAPPCEEFNCFCRRHCASTKAACESFDKYVETGKVLPPGKPSLELYARLYASDRTAARRPGTGKNRWANQRTED